MGVLRGGGSPERAAFTCGSARARARVSGCGISLSSDVSFWFRSVSAERSVCLPAAFITTGVLADSAWIAVSSILGRVLLAGGLMIAALALLRRS